MSSTPSNDSEDRSDEAFGPFACATARSAARAAGAIDTAAHVTARSSLPHSKSLTLSPRRWEEMKKRMR